MPRGVDTERRGVCQALYLAVEGRYPRMSSRDLAASVVRIFEKALDRLREADALVSARSDPELVTQVDPVFSDPYPDLVGEAAVETAERDAAIEQRSVDPKGSSGSRAVGRGVRPAWRCNVPEGASGVPEGERRHFQMRYAESRAAIDSTLRALAG
jgi:hypothetical protein